MPNIADGRIMDIEDGATVFVYGEWLGGVGNTEEAIKEADDGMEMVDKADILVGSMSCK